VAYIKKKCIFAPDFNELKLGGFTREAEVAE
jgi:hypothetical protein